MSLTRIVLLACVTAVLADSAVAQTVLETAGPLEQKANVVSPENPIPRRTRAPAPVYPPEAGSIDATATVVLIASLDQAGNVAEIRKLRDPLVIVPLDPPPGPVVIRSAAEAMVREAALALSQWQYDPPAQAPISFSVTFAFRPGAEPTATQGSSVTSFARAGAGAAPPAPPAAPSPVGSKAAAMGAVRVGGNVRAPVQITRVAPVYPAVAQSARVQGVVILEALIGTDGRIVDAAVLRSVPLLDQAALEAVKQWEYTPTLLNGVPTPVIMTVTVTFTLASPPANQ